MAKMDREWNIVSGGDGILRSDGWREWLPDWEAVPPDDMMKRSGPDMPKTPHLLNFMRATNHDSLACGIQSCRDFVSNQSPLTFWHFRYPPLFLSVPTEGVKFCFPTFCGDDKFVYGSDNVCC